MIYRTKQVGKKKKMAIEDGKKLGKKRRDRGNGGNPLN